MTNKYLDKIAEHKEKDPHAMGPLGAAAVGLGSVAAIGAGIRLATKKPGEKFFAMPHIEKKLPKNMSRHTEMDNSGHEQHGNLFLKRKEPKVDTKPEGRTIDHK